MRRRIGSTYNENGINKSCESASNFAPYSFHFIFSFILLIFFILWRKKVYQVKNPNYDFCNKLHQNLKWKFLQRSNECKVNGKH